MTSSELRSILRHIDTKGSTSTLRREDYERVSDFVAWWWHSLSEDEKAPLRTNSRWAGMDMVDTLSDYDLILKWSVFLLIGGEDRGKP